MENLENELSMNFSGMKKKKKKTTINFDEMESNKLIDSPLSSINCNEIPCSYTDLSISSSKDIHLAMENDQENKPSQNSDIPAFFGVKKKKKKTAFNFDELESSKLIDSSLSLKSCNEILNSDTDLSFSSSKDIQLSMENNQENEPAKNSDIPEFSGVKKKKKKVTFNFDEMESSKPETNNSPISSLNCNQILNCDTDLSFDLLKKKKKKKVNTPDTLNDDIHAKVENVELNGVSDIWHGNSDIEYSYENLLTRVFDIMRLKDPSRDLNTKKKLIMKPPQVIRVGSKKSSFVNFIDICKMLHRSPQHLQSFLLAELGTTASVDGNNQLIIKGRFEQRQIETVLRHYIKEYVTCHTCRSPDTFLQKDIRLNFLHCESCGSRCSVATIKSGFQAVTSKRAAIRAKAT